jgi:putative inorganic carbon (HCO3(-)) transporter
MAAVLIYGLILVNAFLSLTAPWIGVVLSYLFALLTPQNIWWWAFGDLRPVYWIIVPTLVGFAIALLRGRVALSGLATRPNLLVAILWASFTMSYYLGPYVDVVNAWRFYDPSQVFSNMQKTLLMYFVAAALLDDSRKLKFALLVIIVTTAYMTYWANAQYLFEGVYGRLHGPNSLYGGSIYDDENIFATLFVVSFPFLYYFGKYVRSKPLAWAAWLIIPFAWHAIFLTASRGALIGVSSVLVVFALRQKRILFGAMVIAAFVLAFVWQAGTVMKDRSRTITEYNSDTSASSRIDAWEAATDMISAHPLTGVGLASFGQAFPSYSSKRPRIAHNTFLQIAAEDGIVAGITYMVLVASTINRLRKNAAKFKRSSDGEAHLYYCASEACLLGLVGFFACSVFLSLEQFELLYYLLAIANCIVRTSPANSEAAVARAPAFGT